MPTTLQGVQPCTGFPPQQGRLYTQLQPWQSTHHCSKSTVFLWKVISPNLAIAHFFFALILRWMSFGEIQRNLLILTQSKLIFKMGMLFHKRMGLFALSSVPVPSPKAHTNHPLQDSVQHIQAKRVKVTHWGNQRGIMAEWNNLNLKYF